MLPSSSPFARTTGMVAMLATLGSRDLSNSRKALTKVVGSRFGRVSPELFTT